MKRILCLTLVVFNGLIVMGQTGVRNKADIVFMPQEYENSCLFCDSASFDKHAKINPKQLKELSFAYELKRKYFLTQKEGIGIFSLEAS